MLIVRGRKLIQEHKEVEQVMAFKMAKKIPGCEENMITHYPQELLPVIK